MLEAKLVRTLNLAHATQAGRPAFVSAASGLVRFQKNWVVAADDENHIAVFSPQKALAGQAIEIFSGHLPLPTDQRKKVKPDLEALCLFGSGMLCLPSGSTQNRNVGAYVGIQGRKKNPQLQFLINFEPLFNRLKGIFSSLNIEGAACIGDSLILAQRGNSQEGANALIRLDYKKLIGQLAKNKTVSADCLKSIIWTELGSLRNIPLSFTDLCPLSKELLAFSAAAEDTSDTYQDGPCKGSIIGLISTDGKIAKKIQVKTTSKIEGLFVTKTKNLFTCYMVHDDDDSTKPSTISKTEFGR